MSLIARLRLTRTHTFCLRLSARLGSVPQKRAPIEVCQLPPGSLPASVRKNLAVHVSLSSIFTMSKSRPHSPPKGNDVVGEQGLQEFCSKQSLCPANRQHLCPVRIVVSGSALGTCVVNERGYRGPDFPRQHPHEGGMTFFPNPSVRGVDKSREAPAFAGLTGL